MPTRVEPKYCSGTGSKPNKRTKKTVMRYSKYFTYDRVDKYKCPVCQSHVGLDGNGMLYRHGHKITPALKRQRERDKLIKNGLYFTLCADCEQPVLGQDYLCEDCRE